MQLSVVVQGLPGRMSTGGWRQHVKLARHCSIGDQGWRGGFGRVVVTEMHPVVLYMGVLVHIMAFVAVTMIEA